MKQVTTLKLILTLALPWIVLVGTMFVWTLANYLVPLLAPENEMIGNAINFILGATSLLSLIGIPVGVIMFIILLSNRSKQEIAEVQTQPANDTK